MRFLSAHITTSLHVQHVPSSPQVWGRFFSHLSGFPVGSYGAWTSSSSISEYSLFGLSDTVRQFIIQSFNIRHWPFILYNEPYWNENLPLLRAWVDCVPQSVVWIILKRHPCSWVPFSVFLTKAFLGVCPEPQFLTLAKLHQQNVFVVSVSDRMK